MLVRRFVGKKLAEYYSQPSNKVVGSIPEIQLSSLWGEWHWLRIYGRLYREQQGQWLTPVELFRPYYSNTFAKFVTESTKWAAASSPIHIVELGGGRGTNASCILSYLQSRQSDLYDRVSYTIIDASEPLLELQKEVLSTSEHAGKVDIVLQDLMDVAEGRALLLEESTDPTVFIAMELMDNLPHDKIRRSRIGRSFEQAEIQQSSSNDELTEVFVPLEDALLLDMLTTAPSFGGTILGSPAWVPSVACGILRHICSMRPNSSLAFADFDYLPPADLSPSTDATKRRSTLANGEPIVTSMDGADHECYLNAPPCCDVLFPTDFSKLALFAKKCWGDKDAVVETMKQAQFLERYGPEEVNATQSWLTGYSPLIHDFGNCSVLTITPARNEQ